MPERLVGNLNYAFLITNGILLIEAAVNVYKYCLNESSS